MNNKIRMTTGIIDKGLLTLPCVWLQYRVKTMLKYKWVDVTYILWSDIQETEELTLYQLKINRRHEKASVRRRKMDEIKFKNYGTKL